jgi:hypothetical protein
MMELWKDGMMFRKDVNIGLMMEKRKIGILEENWSRRTKGKWNEGRTEQWKNGIVE